jgi:hypothetical protein
MGALQFFFVLHGYIGDTNHFVLIYGKQLFYGADFAFCFF